MTCHQVERNGTIYKGNFKNNKFHGMGFLSSETCRYRGNFKNGKFHGMGFLSSETCRYQGTFKNGKRHGIGKIIYHSGDICHSSHKNGVLHGLQTHKYINGHIYYINYINGQKHGACTLLSTDSKLIYIYEHGQLIKQIFHSYKFSDVCVTEYIDGVVIKKYTYRNHSGDLSG